MSQPQDALVWWDPETNTYTCGSCGQIADSITITPDPFHPGHVSFGSSPTTHVEPCGHG